MGEECSHKVQGSAAAAGQQPLQRPAHKVSTDPESVSADTSPSELVAGFQTNTTIYSVQWSL